MSTTRGHFDSADVCPLGPHRLPEGPNEDVGQCGVCWAPVGVPRSKGEQFGLHLDDCSLERNHLGRCVGGGKGHAPLPVVRGYWRDMDTDVEAARKRHEERA